MNFFHTEISYRNYFSYYKNAENYGLKYIFGVALVYFIDTPDYCCFLKVFHIFIVEHSIQGLLTQATV